MNEGLLAAAQPFFSVLGRSLNYVFSITTRTGKQKTLRKSIPSSLTFSCHSIMFEQVIPTKAEILLIGSKLYLLYAERLASKET